MRQSPGGEFVAYSSYLSSKLRCARLFWALSLAVMIPAVSICAQTRNQINKTKAAVAAIAQDPAPAPAPPPPAPVAPPVQLAPLQAPTVDWDGKLLSIDAENSSLADILIAIRARTGASVDMPPSASTERVFAHLGPAPIREVISSLLYGTNFDYVIQASDADEDGLRSVVLTARGGGGEGSGGASDGVREAGIRLMPGYAAPGKRTYEVMNKPGADSDNSASSASSDTGSAETATASGDASPAGTESASTGAPSSDAQPAAQTQPESTDATSGTGLTASTPLTNRPVGTSMSSEASVSSSTSLPQMVQDLQRLYQQRRQIQAQQNQAAATTPAQTPNN